jgi:glycosyltransferase involved in cell wall biosynthesis
LPDRTSHSGVSSPPPPAYSAVIPVFNSAAIVGETVNACARFFEREGLSYEIVLVDDGSTDGSWEILKAAAAENAAVVAVRLLRNYGQHSAVHCGLALSRGEYVVVLDDDMQNRPEEILNLIQSAGAGADVVFGSFRRKRHSAVRRLGSWLTNHVNTAVFGKPKDLVLTNFKLLHRPLVDRILAHRTPFPYINGLAVMYAQRPTTATVEHHERRVGSSNYGAVRIAKLLTRIVFNYSAVPLRLVTVAGMIVAAASFCFGAYVLMKALIVGTTVPGWASVTVMMAFFNGMTLLVLGMIGEYLIRILKQISMAEPYHVVDVARRE